ncbi:MAG: clostripain-related cysteine peptidase [Armatimonadota bacterium]
MKHVRLAALVSLGGCWLLASKPSFCSAKADWGMALYLAGESDLWQTARYVAEATSAVASESLAVAALLDGPLGSAEGASLLLAHGDRPTERSRQGQLNTGDPASLERFTRAARWQFQAGRWMLVVLGHGMPPVSAQGIWRSGLLCGGLASDWGSGGKSLTPADLEKALAGQRWDVVVLLSCHSASVDYAWALRNSARWVVASPTALTISGRSVVGVAQRLASGASTASTRKIVETVVKQVSADLQPEQETEVVVGIDLQAITDVRDSMRELSGALLEEPEIGAAGLEAIRGSLPWVGPGGEMTDLAALGRCLAQVLPEGAGRRAAERAAAAAVAAVPFLGTTEVRGTDVEQYSGLVVLLPPPLAELWDDYEEASSLARETGWGRLLAMLRTRATAGLSTTDLRREK